MRILSTSRYQLLSTIFNYPLSTLNYQLSTNLTTIYDKRRTSRNRNCVGKSTAGKITEN
ncbi:MAG: hypothetical protein LBE12_01845 [Planctomycetaceae bacterium]|nr:hypothetical protein [Planctomycetaceae bacterium]